MTRVERIQEEIDSVNLLLQECIRDLGPNFLQQQYRGSLTRLHLQLHQARTVEIQEAVQDMGRPRIRLDPSVGYSGVDWGERTLDTLAIARLEPFGGFIRGPFQYSTGRMRSSEPGPQNLPRELMVRGMKIRADSHCPDNLIYMSPQVIPILQPQTYGIRMTDGAPLQRPPAAFERVSIPAQSYHIPQTERPTDTLLYALENMRSAVLRETGYDDLPLEVHMSYRSYAVLEQLLNGKPEPVLVIGPESERFSDEMDVALEEFSKSRRRSA